MREVLIAAVEGVELLVAHRSPYHVTMLLRKTPKAGQAAGPTKDATVTSDWGALGSWPSRRSPRG